MTEKSQSEPRAAKAGGNSSADASASQDQAGAGQEANFKFAQMQAPPEDSYADGAASITVGRNVMKLDFYRVVGFDAQEKKEVRVLSHRIVLPLTAIPELGRLLQDCSSAVQRAMREAAEKSASMKDFSAGDSFNF